jgi:DNA gyrase subunit A
LVKESNEKKLSFNPDSGELTTSKEITEIIEDKYLKYAATVITKRALPSVIDGFKPVQRRILWSMYKLGITHKAPTAKCALVVGDVIGKYHPHGDVSVYEALVRMSQDFFHANNLCEIQGSKGSINDPRSFAAMRYPECRLTALSENVVKDLKYGTVKMAQNYDGTLDEPSVLPTAWPSFLTSSSVGIAVGFVTDCLPYNLKEVCEATIAYLQDTEITDKALLKIVPGPDFASGGIIIEKKGITAGFKTGFGYAIVRSKCTIKDSEIIVTETPHCVALSTIIESISKAAKSETNGKNQVTKEAIISEIASVKDFSHKGKIEVRIKVKKGAEPESVLRKLFKHTRLQEKLSINSMAIHNRKPIRVPFRTALELWSKARIKQHFKKNQYFIKLYKAELNLLKGIIKVITDPEKAIKIIKSNEVPEGITKLMSEFNLNKIQAEHIMNMAVRKFSKTDKLQLEKRIAELTENLQHHQKRIDDEKVIVKDIIAELTEVKEKFGTPRKTEILDVESLPEDESSSSNVEIPEGKAVIYISNNGFVKRLTKEATGKIGVSEGDCIKKVISCDNKSHLLMFSNIGKFYRFEAYKIPAMPEDKVGMNFKEILNLSDSEKIVSYFAVNSFDEEKDVVLVTKDSCVKRSPLKDFEVTRSTGAMSTKLKSKDEVQSVKLISRKLKKNAVMILICADCKVITFNLDEVPEVARTTFGSYGVAGKGVKVIASHVIKKEDLPDHDLLIISSTGFGKKTNLTELKICARRTKGQVIVKLKKDSKVVAAAVTSKDGTFCVVSTKSVLKLKSKDIHSKKNSYDGTRIVPSEHGNAVKDICAY